MQLTTYLVTGAAGFIGFHVAKRLLERGDDVTGFLHYQCVGIQTGAIVGTKDDHTEAARARLKRPGLDEGLQRQAVRQGDQRAVRHADTLTRPASKLRSTNVSDHSLSSMRP